MQLKKLILGTSALIGVGLLGVGGGAPRRPPR